MGSSPTAVKYGIPRWGIPYFGAADRTRTGTRSPSRDFKSLVSTYSTTAAYYHIIVGTSLGRILSPWCLPIPPVVVPGIFVADGAASSSADRGHSLCSLFPPPAAVASLPCCGARCSPCRNTASSLTDHCHSLRSLHLPPAALPSLPTPACMGNGIIFLKCRQVEGWVFSSKDASGPKNSRRVDL